VILHGYLNSSDWTSTCPSPSHPVPWRQDSRLLFSDTWFITPKPLLILLQLPSYLTHHSVSSINSFLKTFFLWSSCFHIYLILRGSTWSILSWLWASHKCWTKLIFFFFLFTCFSCLVWLRWNSLLVDYTHWLYSSICFIIIFQVMYQWIHLYFSIRTCLYT
jgi:hypothetical protein